MNTELFYLVLAIQFIVQLVLYWNLRFIIFNIGLLTAKVTHYDIKYTMKSMLFTALAINILISLFVKVFTSSGATSGITNLFASTILGIFMYFDIVRVTKKLKK